MNLVECQNLKSNKPFDLWSRCAHNGRCKASGSTHENIVIGQFGDETSCFPFAVFVTANGKSYEYPTLVIKTKLT